jgi:hypothetical protein
MVMHHSNTGVKVSNPARGMAVRPLLFVLYFAGRGPVTGILPKCLKAGFTVSEVKSESEQARGPNA